MCNFYKNMNIFFVKLSMLIATSTVVIFLGLISYDLFFNLFNEKVLSEFNLLNFLVYTIIPFATSISIITKLEPDIFIDKSSCKQKG